MARPTDDPALSSLDRTLNRAHGLLPDQGPIGVFIHHNTLHALQHLPFHEAVQEGARLTGARPYLSQREFVDAWRRGRITPADLDAALARRAETLSGLGPAFGRSGAALAQVLMLNDAAEPDPPGVAFRVALDGGADESRLLSACEALAASLPAEAAQRPVIARHHDALVALGHAGTDAVVHRELIRLCAGFVDQGQAHLPMPGRPAGFFLAVAELYSALGTEPRLARGISGDFKAIARDRVSARQVILECLAALGVTEEDTESFVLRTLLALPGWAGMFSRLERHPEEADADAPCRLEEFLAVRLVLERRALARAARDAAVPLDLTSLRNRVPAREPESAAAFAVRLFAVCRALGFTAAQAAGLGVEGSAAARRAMHEFDDVKRRAIWQEAFEANYREHLLNALSVRRSLGPRPRPARAEAQFVFCIDEREESIRRAIEEQGPGLETFGAAGFFGIAIDFRGLYDEEPAAHCPVVVTPDHEVHEAPLYTAEGWHAARVRVRDTWHALHRDAHRSSRTMLGGMAMSLLLGPPAAAIALFRVAFPRLSLGTFTRLRDRLLPRPATRLIAVRSGGDDRTERGKWLGFSLQETTDRVAGTLRSIGLTREFAPVVVVLGHGSSSLNNPHESAHDCGACGGRRGGANARLFAEMANRPAVREALRERGIHIPSETWFIGGLHDTADDGVHYHDVELLPGELYTAFARADLALQTARERSAQERARRFDDAPLGLSPREALQHVEDRATHMAQPRPEYGHCTNASAIVGRRELSRGLHLDRRAFLISYDPSIDPDAAIVERVLAAVGPVGAGISLEYYFSSVDNEIYGCGTKLPHNVTGLVGIMNGHHSDLRTGLPLQMVELHEPMRLLLIVEATTDALLQVAGRQAEVRELVVNEWVQLVSIHPETGAVHLFQDGGFHPWTPSTTSLPTMPSSPDWHGGTRDYVTPALVMAGLRDPADAVTGATHA